jgi:hypothetical protein
MLAHFYKLYFFIESDLHKLFPQRSIQFATGKGQKNHLILNDSYIMDYGRTGLDGSIGPVPKIEFGSLCFS